MEIAKGLEIGVNGSKVVITAHAEKEAIGSVKGALEIELIAILEKFAAATTNKIDDQLVGLVKAALEPQA